MINPTLAILILLWNTLPMMVNIILVLNGYEIKKWIFYLAPITALLWWWAIKTGLTEVEWNEMQMIRKALNEFDYVSLGCPSNNKICDPQKIYKTYKKTGQKKFVAWKNNATLYFYIEDNRVWSRIANAPRLPVY
ncbi:hypothetical protein LCGC14_0175780 [marine sediment metagenome]|uniref:Uncharacterized protein n=1 Tax=marine sediment metagenome TaxID=412755 RepID=A0A0F9UVE0_9ZZZZ